MRFNEHEMLLREGVSRIDACLATLRASMQDTTETRAITVDRKKEIHKTVTWPSSVPEVDRAITGFCGMTVVVSDPGAGKSTLAMASALEAAATGDWHVVYLAAEDRQNTIEQRIRNYVSAHPHTAKPSAIDLFPFVVGRGQTPPTIMGEIEWTLERCRDKSRRLLLVLDSVNSIVNLNANGAGYLKQLTWWGTWAQTATRDSLGDIGFLVISEKNKSGRAKGEGIDYWADSVVTLTPQGQFEVNIALGKQRHSAGFSDLGEFTRVWTRGTFEKEPGKGLRAVGDDDAF